MSLAYSSATTINNKLPTSTSSSNYGSVENENHHLETEEEEENEEDDSEDGSDTLLYHMERKYLNDPYMEDSMDSICWFGTSPCKMATEKSLELLVLNRKNISQIGDVEKFTTYVHYVTELDIAWNRIRSWNVVASLLGALPSLKLLNLSYNPLEKIEAKDLPQIPMASKLRMLVLNAVRIPSDTLRIVLSKMPALKELYLSDNRFDDENDEEFNFGDFSSLHNIQPISLNVEILHLNSCSFTQWNHVLRFVAHFPNVQHLYLCENPLESIDPPSISDEQNSTGFGTAIRSLVLSDCRFSSWESVENLELFAPQLEELRIRQVPLLFDSYTPEEKHHLIVGRLRGLRALNGSSVTDSQREESERFFIRYYMQQDPKPRVFAELVRKHGILDELVKVDLTPRRFAKVVIRCDEIGYRSAIRIRLSSSVHSLMKYAEKITEIPVSRMRLFYIDSTVSCCGPTELRFPNQQLLLLHVEDGDEFFIQSKIVPQKAISAASKQTSN